MSTTTEAVKHSCEGMVYEAFGFGSWYPCKYRGMLHEEGKWWCRVHAPSLVAERKRAREKDAVQAARAHAERKRDWDSQQLPVRQAKAGAVLAGYIRATREVCGTILPGSVLDEALAEFPAE